MGGSILIVDDDEQVRSVLRRKLERCSYDVCEAANGNEAIKALRAMAFDVVITDIIMPDKDGLETIDFVRKAYSQTKVIVISVPQNGLYLESAQALGAARAFAKPLKLEEIASAVAELLAQRPGP